MAVLFASCEGNGAKIEPVPKCGHLQITLEVINIFGQVKSIYLGGH